MMKIPFWLKITNLSTLILITCFLSFKNKSYSQVYKGGGSGNASSGGNTTIINKEKRNKPTKSLGNEIPLIDFSNEAITWEGNTWMGKDNRLFRARFEKYLNEKTAEKEEDKAYRKVLKTIISHLSPRYNQKSNIYEAVKLLPRAAVFENDSNISESINAAVYDVYIALKRTKELERHITQNHREIDQLRKTTKREISVLLDSDNLDTSGTFSIGEKRMESKGKKMTRSGAIFSFTMSSFAIKEAELRASILSKATQGEVKIAEATLAFQNIIVQLLLQRRWEHALIACRLYRHLLLNKDAENSEKYNNKYYKKGKSKKAPRTESVNANNIEIKSDSDIGKFFREGLGMNPTINAVEVFISEIIGDVKKGVDAFNLHVDNNELNAASERLTEAFFIGEYLPEIRLVPLTKKRAILKFVKKAYSLVAAFESKDYGTAEKLLNQLDKEAIDFDSTKIRSAVNSIKVAAKIHLSQAEDAFFRKDNETALENIQLATELWPTNPLLEEKVNYVFKNKGIVNELKSDFDRLYSEKRFNDIMKKFGEFSMAVAGDDLRKDLLKEITEEFAKINSAIEQSKSLHQSGNSYAAWEILEQAREKNPENSDLALLHVKISRDVMQFTSAIDTGSKHEKQGQIGSGLAWYLKAKEFYPRSIYANEAIKRLTAKVIGDDNEDIKNESINSNDETQSNERIISGEASINN